MLTIAATPIGNLKDAAARLKETLAGADVIAAEDTRRTRLLLKLLEVASGAKIVALHDHNEAQKATELAEIARTREVVLVSDAGMPTVSDPGFRLVSAAVAADVRVSVVPGPSAPLAALAVSGLPTDRFAFEGFLPRKTGDLRRLLAQLETDERTLIFFESPQRIATSLAVLAEVFGGERQAAVCRELTKLHEQILRGSLAQLAEQLAARELKGEIVLVVAGCAAPKLLNEAAALERVKELVGEGVRLKDATREVAQFAQVSSRELYQLATKQSKQNQQTAGQ